MKKTVLSLSWFLITPLFLTFTLASAYLLKNSSKYLVIGPASFQLVAQNNTPSSEAIISQVNGVSTSIQTADARPVIIAQFLQSSDSPLKPYPHFGQVLTQIADKYQLDFRLLPAIMMQESNLCKKIPDDSFNCLGLGIHTQGTWSFTSYEQNFEAAAKILREKYIDQGLITPDEIQDKYTPSSNGSWEFAVNHFMEALETAEF